MKKLTLQYECGDWNAVVEVDVVKAAPLCRAVVQKHYPEFCGLIDETDESAVDTYLKAIGPWLVRQSMDTNLKLMRFQRCTPDHLLVMDGSTGISLIQCEKWEFNATAFDVIGG